MNRRIVQRGALFAAVSMFAFGQGAYAQSDANSQADQAQNSDGLGEIVVTARKRSENLQRTPIAITAFSGEALAAKGVARIDDIAANSPGLVLRNDPGSSGATSAAAIFIRGIGQKEYLAGVEPGVGLYVDGVYLARNAGGILDLSDIERVEVLRGPQGTLFGRNTIGGAISVTTVKPQPDLAGNISLTYGSDDMVRAIGTVNVPVTDTLYARASAGVFRRDGFVDYPAQGERLGNDDRATGRFALRWEPTSNLEINFAVDGTTARENGPPAVVGAINFNSAIFNPEGLPLAPPGTTDANGNLLPGVLPPGATDLGRYYAVDIGNDVPVDNLAIGNNYAQTFFNGQDCLSPFFAPYNPEGNQANPVCFGSQYVDENRRLNQGTAPSFSNYDIWGASLTVDYDFGSVQLKSITAYRELSAEYGRDDDGSPLLIGEFLGELDQNQFSQEVQLTGQAFDDRLEWILGGYYFTEEAENPEPVTFSSITIRASAGPITNDSIAFFAQGTFELTEKLKLTAGLRWTQDDKSYNPDQVILENRTPNPAFAPGTRLVPEGLVEETFRQLTPMVNVAYQWSDELLSYATFSRGFKSGGFNQRVFPPRPTLSAFGPEEVDSYEAGLKFQTFNNRLRVNLAGYYTDYSDLQVTVLQGVAPIVQNGGDARVTGFELEVDASPVAGMRIEGSLGLVDAKFTRVDPAATQITLDREFERVPRWTASAAISQDIYGDFGTFTPRVDWAYQSEVFNDVINSEQLRQPSFHLVDASLRWTSPDEVLSITGAVTNVFDEDYFTGYNGDLTGTLTIFPNRGREWSVTLRANF